MHHQAPGILSLFWPTLNFVIYFAFLRSLYRKFGKPGLLGKSVSVKEQIEKGTRMLAQAEQDLAEVKQRDIEAEKKELFERIVAEGKAIASSILEDSRSAALKIDRDAELRIARDFAKVESELKTSVVRRASELARNEFKANLSEGQDRELRKDALRSVLN